MAGRLPLSIGRRMASAMNIKHARRTSIYLSINLSIYLAIYLSIYLFIYLSIYLSISYLFPSCNILVIYVRLKVWNEIAVPKLDMRKNSGLPSQAENATAISNKAAIKHVASKAEPESGRRQNMPGQRQNMPSESQKC